VFPAASLRIRWGHDASGDLRSAGRTFHPSFGSSSARDGAPLVKTGYMALAYWYGEHKHFDVAI